MLEGFGEVPGATAAFNGGDGIEWGYSISPRTETYSIRCSEMFYCVFLAMWGKEVSKNGRRHDPCPH